MFTRSRDRSKPGSHILGRLAHSACSIVVVAIMALSLVPSVSAHPAGTDSSGERGLVPGASRPVGTDPHRSVSLEEDNGEDRFDEGDDEFGRGGRHHREAGCEDYDYDEDRCDDEDDNGEDQFDEGDDEFTRGDQADGEAGCDDYDDGEDRCDDVILRSPSLTGGSTIEPSPATSPANCTRIADDGDDQFNEGDDEFTGTPCPAVQNVTTQSGATGLDQPTGPFGLSPLTILGVVAALGFAGLVAARVGRP